MKFRLGINYWPISSAMYWWQRFDPVEVERDFGRIGHAGFDSVRIFLRWEDFQPAPRVISKQALADLGLVADIAARNDLSLIPTLFTGHMSGVNWIPEWALDTSLAGTTPSRFRIVSGGKVVHAAAKNWYTDDEVLAAQLRLAREVAARLRDKPAVWAYDLGNENSNCVVPPTREAACRWLAAVAGDIRSADPSHAITIGLHMEDLEEDRCLGPAEAAGVSDFLCMHGYPMYSSWGESATDAMLLPFLGIITRWLGGEDNLDVMFEEFGAPVAAGGHAPPPTHPIGAGIPLLQEDEAARFTGRALDALRRFGFLGAMLWCYGDYDAALWPRPPFDQSVHERYFGLWRSDHAPKLALGEVKRLSGSDRRSGQDDYAWIDIPRADYYLNPGKNLRNLYRRFRSSELAPQRNPL